MKSDYSSGYTLIELLLTLSILSILLLIPITKSMSSTTITPQEAELIAKQVKEQLILAQHVAIAHNRNVHIRVDQDTKEFRIRFAIGGDYLVVPFQHSSMLFERMTIFPNSIYFLPNGHPGVSGSFSLRIGDHKYQYTVYLGKGMVAYRKM